jgi:F-type H+-transporting ATPase subunit b
LIKVINERNRKIKEGLDKAKEADSRLKEIDNLAKEKIREAEQESIGIIKNTEQKARILEQDLAKKAEERQKELLAQIQKNAQRQQEEADRAVLDKAAGLVKKALIKTIELEPDKIDEALIKKAVSRIKDEN